uniref:SSD domain-containing protein n=1 Tax=Calidris pygmaea TaxID=425635 RepID=A0A8C3PTF2_9CHAR
MKRGSGAVQGRAKPQAALSSASAVTAPEPRQDRPPRRADGQGETGMSWGAAGDPSPGRGAVGGSLTSPPACPGEAVEAPVSHSGEGRSRAPDKPLVPSATPAGSRRLSSGAARGRQPMAEPRRPAGGCTCRHTDCLERPLKRLFQGLGSGVAACPWPFVLVPLLLSGGLGAGFFFLPQREANDIEEQFTPTWGPAKADRDFVRRYFPTNDSERFSAPRLPTEGAYAALIAVAAGEGSILDRAARRDLRRLDMAVRTRGFEQHCARPCPEPLDGADVAAALENLFFPVSNGTFLGGTLGGVRTDPDGRVLSVRAVRLVYFLRQDGSAAADSRRWLEGFLQDIPSKLEALRAIKVTYFTSVSRQQEFEGNTNSVIPLFSITYFLTITFSIVSCLRLSCIRNNVWLACFGVVSAGLAVLSSFGLLLFCGVPFVVTVLSAPFLILGVGVDDMFILIAAWEQSSRKKEKSNVRSRLAETYAEAALSVTITTLTDVLAFFIGTWTAFPSVRSFCLYTGTAFVFCYIYTLTFFGAIIVLNHRRDLRLLT